MLHHLPSSPRGRCDAGIEDTAERRPLSSGTQALNHRSNYRTVSRTVIVSVPERPRPRRWGIAENRVFSLSNRRERIAFRGEDQREIRANFLGARRLGRDLPQSFDRFVRASQIGRATELSEGLEAPGGSEAFATSDTVEHPQRVPNRVENHAPCNDSHSTGGRRIWSPFRSVYPARARRRRFGNPVRANRANPGTPAAAQRGGVDGAPPYTRTLKQVPGTSDHDCERILGYPAAAARLAMMRRALPGTTRIQFQDHRRLQRHGYDVNEARGIHALVHHWRCMALATSLARSLAATGDGRGSRDNVPLAHLLQAT